MVMTFFGRIYWAAYNSRAPLLCMESLRRRAHTTRHTHRNTLRQNSNLSN